MVSTLPLLFILIFTSNISSAANLKLLDRSKVLTCETPYPISGKSFYLGFAGDDKVQVYLDGEQINSTESWQEFKEIPIKINFSCGVISFRVIDVHGTISGFIAYLRDEKNQVLWSTSDSDPALKVTSETPSKSWTKHNFNDFSWVKPILCHSGWDGKHADAKKMGAKWVWSKDCQKLGQSYFRLNYSFE